MNDHVTIRALINSIAEQLLPKLSGNWNDTGPASCVWASIFEVVESLFYATFYLSSL